MQERGLCGERGGEEIRSLQGLISEDEEGGEEDEGEEEDGGKDEEDGEDEEQRREEERADEERARAKQEAKAKAKKEAEAKAKQEAEPMAKAEAETKFYGEDSKEADQKATEKILDCTEQDLVNLRRSIYLVIMSSLHFEECVHKILKLNIAEGQEKEVVTMLIDCCAMERMFNRFFALQAERLCRLNPAYQERFEEAFGVQFATVHRLETNKLRNIGKFFAHLLYSDGISWSILNHIRITEETTTSSSRIFIKVIFQELCEQWGIKKLVGRLQEPELEQHFQGLFPRDNIKNVRFAINYFTAIGLGVLTEDLRSYMDAAGVEKAQKALEEASTSDESDSEGSDSSSSSSSS